MLTRAMVPLLEGSGGDVINISSIAAVDGFRGAAAYYAAKAGLEGMSRALVEELRPKGIRPFSVPERPRPGCGRRFQAISTSKDIPPEVAAESVEFLLAQTRRAWRETLVLCPPGGKV